MRQEQRSAATRAAIVAAAREHFGQHGFDGASVDRIAAQAGVAKGAVYHHFPGKHDLFEAAFEQVAAEIAALLAERLEPGPDPVAALLDCTRAFFKACAEPAVSAILLRDAPGALGQDRFRQLDERHFGGLVRSGLAMAMAAGAIDRQPVEPLARLLLAAIQAAALDAASTPDFRAQAELYLGSLESLLRGLGRPE